MLNHKVLIVELVLLVVFVGFVVHNSLVPINQMEVTPPITASTGSLELKGTKATSTTQIKPPVSPIKATSTATSTKPVTKVATKPTTTPVVKPTTPIIPVTPTPSTPTVIITPPEPAPDFEAINTFTRKTLVNVYCVVKGNELSPISGTGVVISPDGVVLTNAHVAQYFLLRDYHQKGYINCILRDGSPAYPRYNVDLVYISPTWVENNKTMLKSQNPTGTGVNDFAFLRITNRIDGTNLPTLGDKLNLPYLVSNVKETSSKGEPVVLVSYPAGFLGGISILKDLSATSAVTTVQDVYTFKASTIDVLAVGGTVVSQKGASGGAVVDGKGTLLGIISTSSNGTTTSTRNLNAITLGYINRSLQTEIKITLDNFLSQDTAIFAKNFQENTAPLLTKMITDELDKI